MKKRIHLIILIVFIVKTVSAQSLQCGTDQLLESHLLQDPALKQKENSFNNTIRDFVTRQTVVNRISTTLTIPVVFHIIHTNGPENIADSLVSQAVENLNLRYQNAAPFYDSTGHAVNIQFCLATVDPAGNPTSGITRSFNTITVNSMADEATVKLIDWWNSSLYLNIWTVSSITNNNVDGYSTFPFSAGQPNDGIVIEAQYITGFLLTHESGHYLGLYHTFWNGCYNQDCLQNGDFVCDTPPDNTYLTFTCMGNSCSTDMDDTTGLSPFTTDVNELPNFMDYTTCPLSFSQGQADRMNYSLSSLRQSLLQSNGCGNNPGGQLPIASFTLDSTWCSGAVRCISSAVNGFLPQWDFDSDGIYDAIGIDVTHSYTASGTYIIKMFVAGFGGADSSYTSVTITVPPNALYPINSYTGNIFTDVNSNLPTTCSGTTFNFYGEPGMASYLWSTGETTQDIMFVATAPFTISLTTTDAQGNVWKNCNPVSATMNLFSPTLSLMDTVLCETLFGLYVSGNWVSNVWYCDGSIIGQNTQSFQYTLHSPGMHYFQVNLYDYNGCVLTSNLDSVYSQPPPNPDITLQNDTLFLNHGCLNTVWYFNGTPIPFASNFFYVVSQNGCYTAFCDYCGLNYSDTICITNVGISEAPDQIPFSIAPNPADDVIHLITLRGKSISRIEITDLPGKTLIRQNDFTGSDIDIHSLAGGIYLLKAEIENRMYTVRFMRR